MRCKFVIVGLTKLCVKILRGQKKKKKFKDFNFIGYIKLD